MRYQVRRGCVAIARASILTLLLVVSAATAEPKFPPLVSGMAPHDVLALWGEPLEREEREASRAEVWIYTGQARAFFSQGKLVAWSGLKKVEVAVAAPVVERGGVAPQLPAGESATAVDDLLTEILKDVPSAEDGSPSAGSASGVMPLGGVSVPPPMPIPPNPND